MIEAAKLDGDEGGQIAVTLRAATATETFNLLQRLFISRCTVQDHLKSVFEKTGVRSRRQLLARFARP